MKQFKLSNFIIEPKGKIAKRMIYKDDKVIAFTLNIAKGETLPPHTHFDSTVLIEVLAGEANLQVGGEAGEKFALTKQDLIQLDGPELMSIDNIGQETLVLYITISPAPPTEDYATDLDI